MILRNQNQPNISIQKVASVPFKVENVQTDYGLLSLQGLNPDLIKNGSFLLGVEDWDFQFADLSELDGVGALLYPASDYSIKQDIIGDPTKYYKLTFKTFCESVEQTNFSDGSFITGDIDGFLKVEIIDKQSGNLIFTETVLANNVVSPRFYNITGIGEAELRFYAINRSMSLTDVSMTDGPLMASDRANFHRIDNFLHSYDDWEFVNPNDDIITPHQTETDGDGACLAPFGSTQVYRSILSSTKGINSRIVKHLPYVNYSEDFITTQRSILDMDFGYENNSLYIYLCESGDTPRLRKVNISGVSENIELSFNRQFTSIKRHPTLPILWAANNFPTDPYVREINLNNPSFPQTYSFALDINIEAIAYDSVGNQLYVVGQDRTFLPAIRSSVYKFDRNNFNAATKIYTKDGLYKSIECTQSVPDLLGGYQPLSARIIIGGDKSVPFGFGTHDKLFVVIDPSGAVDYSFDVPEIQSADDLSAVQIEDGSRPGFLVLVSDSTSDSVFTLDVRSRYRFKHYISNDVFRSISLYFNKPPYKMEKDYDVDPSKWYVIDTDVVNDAWASGGPLQFTNKYHNIYTTDDRIRNADTGQSGSDVTLGTSLYSIKTRDNLFSRMLYRPSSDVMRLGIDSLEFDDSNIELNSDGNKLSKVFGVMVSDIDLNNITPVLEGQVKEIFTFDNDTQGWCDNTYYKPEIQSVNVPLSIGPDAVFMSKTFNVRRFKKVRIGININTSNLQYEREPISVLVNGVFLFDNQVGEYNNIINKTGYFEYDFVPQVEEITISIGSSLGQSTINYICVCYYEPSDLYDPCNISNVNLHLSLKGVPTRPYNIYGVAMKYTLRDYFDPTIRGSVLVPAKNMVPNTLSLALNGSCYNWAQFPNTTVNPLNIDQGLLNTAVPGNVVNSEAFTKVISPYANQFISNGNLPILNFVFYNYYEDIPNRITSGNSICTQHQNSPFFKPCVIESMEVMFLMASAPNLASVPNNLFGTNCGTQQVMDVRISYNRDGLPNTVNLEADLDLINVLQVNGVNPSPCQSGIDCFTKMSQARWEAFKVNLDLPSGIGADQCTEPIDGYLIQGSSEMNFPAFSVSPTGAGAGNGGGFCVVNVIIEVVSDGSVSQSVQKITLSKPTGGSWRIVYGDITTGDVTDSIPWNATASQIQSYLENLSSLEPGDVLVSGVFPNYVITFDAGLGIVPNLQVINNLTCDSSDIGYVNPGPYSYSLPKPAPNTNVEVPVDTCNACPPFSVNTVNLHKESINVGCLSDNCSNPIKTLSCRFVNNSIDYNFYLLNDNSLKELSDDYFPSPGDRVVMIENSIQNIPLDKILRSFTY